jgi:hypothetical protein
MSEANAHADAADGNPLAIPGRCVPWRATDQQSAVPGGDGQLLRQLFIDHHGRIRDPYAGLRAGHKVHRLNIAIDKEVYLRFQEQCRQHDLSVAMALQLMMSGREWPAARPVMLQLPAVVDAEALRVLLHLDQRVAACQAEGAMDSAEAIRLREHLAGISTAIGGTPCPCAGRERPPRPDRGRREDA